MPELVKVLTEGLEQTFQYLKTPEYKQVMQRGAGYVPVPRVAGFSFFFFGGGEGTVLTASGVARVACVCPWTAAAAALIPKRSESALCRAVNGLGALYSAGLRACATNNA